MAIATKSHLVHMRFKFPKGCKDREGRLLQSLVVRELDTFDAKTAGLAADANNTHFVDELIAIAIVEVNGEPLHGPANTEGWNLVAKEFATRCYAKLNLFDGKEAEENLGNGEVVATAPTKASATAE
jgi:hypothetical protein